MFMEVASRIKDFTSGVFLIEIVTISSIKLAFLRIEYATMADSICKVSRGKRICINEW